MSTADISPWTLASAEVAVTAADAVPEGWYTTQGLMRTQFKGLSLSRVSALVHELVKAKRVEVRKFRILLGSGSIRSVQHYKLSRDK